MRCFGCKFKRLFKVIIAVHIILTICISYSLFRRKYDVTEEDEKPSSHVELEVEVASDEHEWSPWGEENEDEALLKPSKVIWNKVPVDEKEKRKSRIWSISNHTVEIWGKAAIGLYLWEHIIGGELEERLSGVWKYGQKNINNIQFIFRTGPGVVPEKVPKNVRNLILVLNGREKNKVEFSQIWLEYLTNFKYLQNVGVVLLGNEKCQNDWIKPYMSLKQKGSVKFVFVVYDAADIDNQNFYQWPLGVATYRNFPVWHSSEVPAKTKRKYLCNFMGTVYPNSSRETLIRWLKQSKYHEDCFVKYRTEWKPLETAESLEEYVRTLLQSDLTLNPVGKNTECYRIYEAASLGSVPVVEDVMTPGKCGASGSQDSMSASSALRLLKEYKAPFIYIKDWSELGEILEKERQLTPAEVVKRRTDVLKWYESFKVKMRDRFVKIVWRHFFSNDKKKYP